MEYNTTRNKLILPEYGRHIQNLVNHIKNIEDREERTQAAHGLISVMAQVNTNLKENGDFKHKLWDHLYILADFDLDVDAPFEIPSKETLNKKPNSLPYTQGKFKKKHYGKIIQNIIDKIDEHPEDEQNVLIELIANQLKKSYVKWNKDSVDDEVIMNDFIELADKKINFKEDLKLVEIKNILPKPKKKKNNRKNRN